MDGETDPWLCDLLRQLGDVGHLPLLVHAPFRSESGDLVNDVHTALKLLQGSRARTAWLQQVQGAIIEGWWFSSPPASAKPELDRSKDGVWIGGSRSGT